MKRGRPATGRKVVPVGLALPPALDDRLELTAREVGLSKSRLATHVMTVGLDHLDHKVDAAAGMPFPAPVEPLHGGLAVFAKMIAAPHSRAGSSHAEDSERW